MTLDANVVDRFREQAATTPSAVALSGRGMRLSYADLDRMSDRVASLVASAGLEPEEIVAFQVRRGPYQAVVMLAILKAGLAFLPLDANLPPSRRAFLLDDSGCRLLLSFETSVEDELKEAVRHIDLGDPGLVGPGRPDHLPTVTAASLAYCLYTSGSTGDPKGVLIEHRGVVLLADSLDHFYASFDVRRHYQFFSLSFDASIWETFYSLLNGIELVVDDGGPAQMEPDELLDQLDRDGVDCLMTTPSFLARATPRRRPGLRTITVCGEACPVDLAAGWATHHRFVNAYGPTENTVGATMTELHANLEEVTIGRPMQHVAVLVLDEDGEPVTDGEAGELVLAGPAVARGYHARPELNGRAFVRDDHSRFAPGRAYRTGDLGRRRPDGHFEFLGRLDDQVKVRGYRVEPGEIETALRLHPSIDQAAVVAYGPQAAQSLAAFVVGPEPIDAAECRRRLRDTLPAHMVPLVLEQIDALPSLPSGKTDRNALRERAARRPEDHSHAHDGDSVVEAAWRRALGRDSFAESDDFFALGGHSALALQVVGDIRAALETPLPLRTLFEHPTLEAFKRAVDASADA